MGYTHYWNHTKPFTEPEWQTVKDAFKAIVEVADLRRIDLSIDNSTPMSAHQRINAAWVMKGDRGEDIYINGAESGAHETFVIHKEAVEKESWQDEDSAGFDFCKTNQKPYDAIITAMLIWLESTYPNHFSVSSDGEKDDWMDGMDVLIHAFGDNSEFDFPKSLRDPISE